MMIDITDKRVTLRRAVAEATVVVNPAVALAIRQGEVPKGSVADVTRAAEILNNWERAVGHFVQVCPKEMLVHLPAPLSLDKGAIPAE